MTDLHGKLTIIREQETWAAGPTVSDNKCLHEAVFVPPFRTPCYLLADLCEPHYRDIKNAV